MVITNYPEGKEEWLEAENNPEEEVMTYRQLPFSKELYIEREDFQEEAHKKFFRLTLGTEVRLKNAYIIKGESVVKDENGNITEIHVTYDEDSKSGSGSEASQKKSKRNNSLGFYFARKRSRSSEFTTVYSRTKMRMETKK